MEVVLIQSDWGPHERRRWGHRPTRTGTWDICKGGSETQEEPTLPTACLRFQPPGVTEQASGVQAALSVITNTEPNVF